MATPAPTPAPEGHFAGRHPTGVLEDPLFLRQWQARLVGQGDALDFEAHGFSCLREVPSPLFSRPRRPAPLDHLATHTHS